MFPRCLTRSFWVLYENLFKGLMTNMLLFLSIVGIISFLSSVFPVLKSNIFIMILLHIVFFYFLFCTVLTGVSHYWIKVIKRDENIRGIFREIGEGIRLYWLKGLMVFLINCLFFAAAFFVINFYRAVELPGVLGHILGGLGIWITIMFLIMQIYVLPILILDEKRRVFISYKKAAIMVISAPFSSFFITGFIAYLMLLLYPASALFFGKTTMPMAALLISLMPIFFLPFLSYNYINLLSINAAMLIYEKHGTMDDLSESWENKGLRHFFKPWENK